MIATGRWDFRHAVGAHSLAVAGDVPRCQAPQSAGAVRLHGQRGCTVSRVAVGDWGRNPGILRYHTYRTCFLQSQNAVQKLSLDARVTCITKLTIKGPAETTTPSRARCARHYWLLYKYASLRFSTHIIPRQPTSRSPRSVTLTAAASPTMGPNLVPLSCPSLLSTCI
jgi:hypothetical protein